MAGNAFSRVRNIVRAEMEDVLKRMENPRKLVNQMLIDMERAFDGAVSEVSRAIANEKIIERRLRKAEAEVARLQDDAEKAVRAGNDGAARRALEEKVGLEMTIADLKTSHEEAQSASSKLKGQLADLRSKLETARNRRHTLAVRKQQAAGPASAPGIDKEPFDAFDALVTDVERDEIASEVYAEITDLKSPDPDLEKMARDRKVQSALADLKQRNQEAG